MKINASPLRRFLSIQRSLFLEKYLIENVEKYISKPSTFQNFLGGDAPRPPPPPKKKPPSWNYAPPYLNKSLSSG